MSIQCSTRPFVSLKGEAWHSATFGSGEKGGKRHSTPSRCFKSNGNVAVLKLTPSITKIFFVFKQIDFTLGSGHFWQSPPFSISIFGLDNAVFFLDASMPPQGQKLLGLGALLCKAQNLNQILSQNLMKKKVFNEEKMYFTLKYDIKDS